MAQWVGSAARTGAVARNVHCEKCGAWYHYMLLRQARADAVRGDEGGAAEAAEAQAALKVTRGLASDVEIAPCPECGWVQAEMVGEATRRAGRSWGWVAACFLAVGAAVLVIAYAPSVTVAEWEMPAERARVVRAVWVTCAGMGTLALLIRAVARWRANPNAGYPKWPRGIRGAVLVEKGKAGANRVLRREK